VTVTLPSMQGHGRIMRSQLPSAPWPGLRRGPIEAPDLAAYEAARGRLAQLGARPGDGLDGLAAWVAACQRRPIPWLVSRVRVIVLAGDHGIAEPTRPGGAGVPMGSGVAGGAGAQGAARSAGRLGASASDALVSGPLTDDVVARSTDASGTIADSESVSSAATGYAGAGCAGAGARTDCDPDGGATARRTPGDGTADRHSPDGATVDASRAGAGDATTGRTPGSGGVDADSTARDFADIAAGHAPVAILAREHNVRLRLFDIGVDADLPADLSPLSRFKMARSTRPIQVADALSPARTELDLLIGELVASAEIAAGADLLVVGDVGRGHTIPAAALIAATLGLRAEQVVGRSPGSSEQQHLRRIALVNQALDRVGTVTDPVRRLAALGSPSLAVGAGVMVTAARRGVPILLDGAVSAAQALLAEEISPGVAAWCRPGHRSTDPAAQAVLMALGLEPVLDLGLQTEDGSGALIALPVLRSAVRLLRDLPAS